MSNLPSLVPFVFSFEVSKTDEQDEDEPVAIVVVDFQGDTKLAKRRKFNLLSKRLHFNEKPLTTERARLILESARRFFEDANCFYPERS